MVISPLPFHELQDHLQVCGVPGDKVVIGDDLRFGVAGLDRKRWSSAGPIRTIFKVALR